MNMRQLMRQLIELLDFSRRSRFWKITFLIRSHIEQTQAVYRKHNIDIPLETIEERAHLIVSVMAVNKEEAAQKFHQELDAVQARLPEDKRSIFEIVKIEETDPAN
jgi:hypothetical protein